MPDLDRPAGLDRYADFGDLTFDRPSPGVLRITRVGPGLTAVSHAVHRQLADVWLVVDRDPDTNVAVLQGAGKAFSAGGSFELLDDLMSDSEVRTRVLTDLVFHFAPTAPALTRGAMWLAGSYPGCRASVLEQVLMRREVARAELRELLSWDFDRLIMAHGEVIETDGKAALRGAYRWLGV